MSILPIEPAACNAVPFPVRNEPAQNAITFPAVLTDELFEQWLDEYPGRRQSHERHTPEEQQRTRARVHRMYILRGSPVTQAYAHVLAAADALHDALESLLSQYGAREAESVLKAAGLPVPHEYDICQAYGAHTFQEQRKDCRRMKRDLGEFIDSLHELTYVLPDITPGEPPQVAPAPARKPAPVESVGVPADVTPDACTKAAWALTASAEELLGEVQEFNERFAGLADHKQLEQPIRDAAGVAWALDMYVSCQYGQLSRTGEGGERLAQFDKKGVCLKPATNTTGNARHAA